MDTPVSAIGGFEDWPEFIRSRPVYSGHSPASNKLAGILGVPALPHPVPEPSVRSVREVDGVSITELRWQLPFGPPTTGYLAAPVQAPAVLPGLLWLHCHAGNKWLGCERILDLGSATGGEAAALQETLYAGLAPANELAKAGFAVLIHDAFSWGSRRFNLDPAPQRTARVLDARLAAWAAAGTTPTAVMLYDAAAADHENTVAKAAGMLGTSYAGMVAFEDLTALAILRRLPGVDPACIGTGGFSGGGGRALMLAALDPEIKACVVACMMTTISALFPSHLDHHSWLMNTPGLASNFDWPDLAALAPATRFLVQYCTRDPLFPLAGMQEADAVLQRLLAAPGRYSAQWDDGGHIFGRELLLRACSHLLSTLAAPVAQTDEDTGRPAARNRFLPPDVSQLPASARMETALTPDPAHLPSPARTGTTVPAGNSRITVPRIALIGVHGFGARHLQQLRILEAAGILKLTAVADPRPPEPGTLDESVAVFATAQELLAADTAPEVVIIATPIHTHAGLAVAALEAGADVYLEKPAAASMEQYRQILAVSERTGRAVQVGFQSLGSKALDTLAEALDSGALGTLRGISATGQWVRNTDYFRRSRWAGKRVLDGVDVVDGVITNPLAHAVATALRIGGARQTSDVRSVEVDAYRAHDIEGDDTSVVRLRTADGTTILCALTVCAPEQKPPYVTVHGTEGEAVLYYTTDDLELTTAAGTTRTAHARADLLENLLAHRQNGTTLLSSLADSGAFMSVLEAVRCAGPVHPIGAEHITWVTGDGAAHPVVHGIEDLMLRAVRAQATFSELLAPWARPVAAAEEFTVGGTPVARLRSGDGLREDASPRPYLHPVTTLSGVQVTDHLPSDHVWHLGAGVALQDVNGINFWGGRTYRREAAGYVWREDHGRIRETAPVVRPDALEQSLAWCGPDGTVLLTEQRNWQFEPLDAASWLLELEFTLTAAAGPVLLGSPGSNGRQGGGYGGFFWRLPACTDVRVRTADHEGEEAVHGTVAPWLAWSAEFDGGPATLVFVPDPRDSDPWFVRCSGYPGVGLSLAEDTPVQATSSAPVSRSVRVVVADGRLDGSRIAQLVAALPAKEAIR